MSREVQELEDTRVSFVVGQESDGCVQDLIDHGITDHQMRWIYSNYSEEQLVASGWDASALENSDGDDSAHKWSEIDANCPDEDILISAVADACSKFVSCLTCLIFLTNYFSACRHS